MCTSDIKTVLFCTKLHSVTSVGVWLSKKSGGGGGGGGGGEGREGRERHTYTCIFSPPFLWVFVSQLATITHTVTYWYILFREHQIS